jgi:2',3'-cyclic-nucleotide 2'-phosphodiesterase (5'-nucleotidase family)
MFKKLFAILLILFLSSCTIYVQPSSNNIEEDVIQNLTIFTINDLHGALEEKDAKGFAYISGYIEEYKENYDGEVIFVANGDILQGTALSYLSFGATVIEALNLASLDAFTIGNHEFDWGIEVIESFVDGSNDFDVKANFPFLGANIYEKSTNQRLDFLEPYTIINKGDISIGIIGVIGERLEGSISPSRVNPYEFVDPIPLIKDITRDLRVNKNVDTVIVMTHDATTSFNNEIKSLSGDYVIDALINGHTHYEYANHESRSGYANLPIIQSGANGNYLGRITLEINLTKNKVLSSSVNNLNVRNLYYDGSPNQIVKDYIDEEVNRVDPIVNELIGHAARTIYTSDALVWAANVIKKATNADIAFINSGSFRNQAFPVNSNEEITYGLLFEMMPFDNIIKTTKIKGIYLQQFMDLTKDGMIYDSDFKGIDTSKTYTIATVDFVFDKSYNPFLYYGDDTQNTQIFIRDILRDDIKSFTDKGLHWDPYK